MWTLKLVFVYGKGTLFGNLCKKYNVTLYGYPHSYKLVKDEIECIISGKIVGSDSNIKKFLTDLEKERRCVNLEYNNGFIVTRVLQHKKMKKLFDPDIVYIKPAITNTQGEYIFEIATWDRDKLNEIIKEYQNFILKNSIKYIKKQQINHIQIVTSGSNLTDKQKHCFSLAQKNGYYEFPRKITLKNLAKIAKISYTTFQFHLRQAEKKILSDTKY